MTLNIDTNIIDTTILAPKSPMTLQDGNEIID